MVTQVNISNTILFLTTLSISLLIHLLAVGQVTFIPPQSSIFAFAGDTISIFDNMINNGRFGSAPGAAIRFSGPEWKNAVSSSFPGKDFRMNTAGGLFIFSGTKKQALAGGFNINNYSGPSFPNIAIKNSNGIYLKDLNDLHIRGSLHFKKGFLFLNGWNVFVDDSITGYSGKSFIITGGNVGSGSLYRKTILNKKSPLIFPIGTDINSYSPLGIKVTDPISHVIGATVFNHVYEHAINGRLLDSDFVKKTWQLHNSKIDAPVTLLLQHKVSDEGERFSLSKDSSYISDYNLKDRKWDRDTLMHQITYEGVLTTASPDRRSYVNDRFLPKGFPYITANDISWFSVTVPEDNTFACPVATINSLIAERDNFQWVELFWSTLHEVNVKTYEVQRRRDSSDKFKTIANLAAKNTNGFSNELRYYHYADDNEYDSWTYYRLKITNEGGCVVYTAIKKVAAAIGIEVWPNPSPDIIHIRVSGIKNNVTMQIVNTLGQFTGKYTIKNNQIVSIKGLPDATYFLIFYDQSSRLIKTIKLVVQHKE